MQWTAVLRNLNSARLKKPNSSMDERGKPRIGSAPASLIAELPKAGLIKHRAASTGNRQ